MLSDMDGTLIDSVPAVEQAWRILAAEFDVDPPEAYFHGRTVQAVVAALAIPAGQRARAEQRLTEIESRDGQVMHPLPGVQRFLEALPTSSWGIVTSANRPITRARFGASGLPDPAFVITGDDVVMGKPAPEPFAKGLLEVRRRGHHGPVIALEDAAAGLISARTAGCLTIGIVGTLGRDELAKHAHYVIDSLEALRVCVLRSQLTIAATPNRVRLHQS